MLPAVILWAVALAGCGEAASPGPTPLSTSVQRLAWEFAGQRGERLVTAHYDIHTTSRSRELQSSLPGFMEAGYEHYCRLTGLAPGVPRGPMPVYVLGTRPEWVRMTEQLTGPRSGQFTAVENGGYCHEGVCVFWDMGLLGTFTIAAHEGLHQFLHHRLRDGLPAWTEEGLSVAAEGFELSGAGARFRPESNSIRLANLHAQLAGGRWIPLRTLLSTDAGDHVGPSAAGTEYYGQLWSLLLLLRSRPEYRRGLERLIADAAEGRLREALKVPTSMGAGRAYHRGIGQAVFQRYIEPDLDAFERQWQVHARALARLRP